MNSGLLTILASTRRPLADLPSYGQGALTLWQRFVSAMQAWAGPVGGLSGPSLIAAAAAGAVAFLLFVCLIVLRIRTGRETRKLREEIAAQVARAETAESANVAKAEFLGTMSHQIRTPLNAIVGFTELALKTDLGRELREYLDTVRTSADWLMYTVNDVLEFSRIEAGTVQLDNAPFSLSECILSAMKMVEREAAAKKLVTGCKIDPEFPQMVCGDSTRLRHVIFNLLDNAVRFTTSGSVILSATTESNGADDVLVRVAVTDTGIGIPPAKRPQIFEPFRKVEGGANAKSRATVLGLAISRRLIELMGGTLDFQSQLGAGSTFEFTARFEKHKGAELEASASAPESVGPKELSILVAEDNAVNRRLITKVLESAGHRVWVAASGKEAVHNVQSEAFDLILMDMEMPDLNGLEATQAIRKDEAPGLRVPIYALTAHAAPSDRDQCFAAGMDGFLTKPIAVDELLHLVSKLTPGARSTAPKIAADIAPQVAEKPPSVPVSELKAIAAAPADYALPAKYLRQEIASGADTQACDEEGGGATADSDEIEFALKAILKNPDDLGQKQPGESYASEIPATAASATDDPRDREEVRQPEPSPYLLVTASDAETHKLSGTNGHHVEPAKEPSYIECSYIESPYAEPSYVSSDHSGLASNGRLSAPAGLALLQAATESTPPSAPLARQNDTGTLSTAWDPFEHARKALTNSRFDVRVIHNNGDPSDRNLI